jgi:hypothetical protein
MKLNEKQRSIASHALYIAAERYDGHAKALWVEPSKPGHKSIAERFEFQAEEARGLAAELDDYQDSDDREFDREPD